MIVREFVEYTERERAIIANVPFTFILVALLISGLVYAASRWKHGTIIELLRQ